MVEGDLGDQEEDDDDDEEEEVAAPVSLPASFKFWKAAAAEAEADGSALRKLMPHSAVANLDALMPHHFLVSGALPAAEGDEGEEDEEELTPEEGVAALSAAILQDARLATEEEMAAFEEVPSSPHTPTSPHVRLSTRPPPHTPTSRPPPAPAPLPPQGTTAEIAEMMGFAMPPISASLKFTAASASTIRLAISLAPDLSSAAGMRLRPPTLLNVSSHHRSHHRPTLSTPFLPPLHPLPPYLPRPPNGPPRQPSRAAATPSPQVSMT